MRPDPRWVLATLFAAGLVLSGATAWKDIQPNDEGLMLRAAARIAAGEVPYRDFWWFYPPGQPYLLAGLHELLGPSLTVWRVVRVLVDALVAVLAFALARRGGAGRSPALVAWLVAACAMAWPSGPHPFPIALALVLGTLLALESRPALAGVLAGACAAWRLEFAAVAAAGGALGLLAGSGAGAGRWRAGSPAGRGTGCGPVRDGSLAGRPAGARPGPGGHPPLRGAAAGPRAAVRLLAAAALTAAALYAPVVAAAGAGPSWDLLVDYPLTDFRDFQALPFPLDYDGPLNTSSVRGFVDDSVEPLLLFHLPLVLVVGLAAGLAALCDRRPRTLATAVVAVGMLAYLLVRADAFHTAPLAVLVAILGAWALGEPSRVTTAMARGRATRTRAGGGGWGAAEAREGGSRPHARRSARPARAARRAAGAVCALVLAYAAIEGLDRRWLALREATVPLDLPHAGAVEVPARQAAALERAVRAARRLVPPARPLYVTGLRADRVTAGHPLFNVLAERPNPTRYDIAAPGVVTTAAVQREIVAALERTRTPLVVRWTDPLTAAPEPNAAGRSSGVRLLDEHLARRYAPAGRFGPFLLLTRRP